MLNGNNQVALRACSDAGQCDPMVFAGDVPCPLNACAPFDGMGGGSCACAKDADCPAQLPYCYPNFACQPPCGADEVCCYAGGCMPASTNCNTGVCAAEPYN